MSAQKILYYGHWGVLADEISHIDGEKVRALKVAINGVDPDVISVHMPSMLPTQRIDCLLGGLFDRRGFRANEGVLPIGFIPNRYHFHPLLQEHLTCFKLGLCLMGEAIPHTDRIFFKFQHDAPIASPCLVQERRRRGHENASLSA